MKRLYRVITRNSFRTANEGGVVLYTANRFINQNPIHLKSYAHSQ